MHIHKLILIIAFLFSFNLNSFAEHHEGNVVVEDAIIVESEFDLGETYEESRCKIKTTTHYINSKTVGAIGYEPTSNLPHSQPTRYTSKIKSS